MAAPCSRALLICAAEGEKLRPAIPLGNSAPPVFKSGGNQKREAGLCLARSKKKATSGSLRLYLCARSTIPPPSIHNKTLPLPASRFLVFLLLLLLLLLPLFFSPQKMQARTAPRGAVSGGRGASASPSAAGWPRGSPGLQGLDSILQVKFPHPQ